MTTLKTPMIVNEANKQKIEDIITEAEGRSTVRCIDFECIVKSIAKIEKKLDVPKSKMEGVRFSVDVWAQNFPRKYKYTAESTQFTISFLKGKWRLVSVSRQATRTACHDFVCEVMPEETKTAIISKMMDFC